MLACTCTFSMRFDTYYSAWLILARKKRKPRLLKRNSTAPQTDAIFRCAQGTIKRPTIYDKLQQEPSRFGCVCTAGNHVIRFYWSRRRAVDVRHGMARKCPPSPSYGGIHHPPDTIGLRAKPTPKHDNTCRNASTKKTLDCVPTTRFHLLLLPTASHISPPSLPTSNIHPPVPPPPPPTLLPRTTYVLSSGTL